MNYWVAVGMAGFVYLVIDALICIRSKSVYIIRRSPWLVHLSLWGNFLEFSSILPLLTYFVDRQDISPLLVSLRDSGIILGHCLLYFPYILRSYRLYLVFNLETNWDKAGADFTKKIHRTRQSWQIKMLILFLLLPLSMCIFLISYGPIKEVFPVTNTGQDKRDKNIATGIYIFITFAEQLALIIFANLLRDLEDEYNMCNELVWITVILALPPIFSTFVETDKEIWFTVCLIRNFLIMARSDIIPLLLSFKATQFAEALTVDMLNSLEIILENEKTLEFFERFLKNDTGSHLKESGYSLLCLYKDLECRLNNSFIDDQSSFEIELSKSSNFALVEKVDLPEAIKKKKSGVFKLLNEKFYQNFLRSEECKELRRIIHKEEIIAYRVMQTSFIPTNLTKKKREKIFIQ